MSNMFTRPQLTALSKRLAEPRRFIQILAGPRQVGKTTLVRQAESSFPGKSHYASADQPAAPTPDWITQQWRLARLFAEAGPALLVLDEVQKAQGWSEAVKRLWDEDSAAGVPLRVVLLGSSQFLMQRGLTESLAGRFELIRMPHWSFSEMRDAFGWDVDRFVFFGGYPAAASLIDDEERWRSYLLDAVIEPTVSRDVLQLARIDKPALLRRLFVLGCRYSGQMLSYQKMLGQLQDVGNTTTLAHYLDLLGGAWMLTGLPKYAGDQARSRGSSPKLLAHDTALVSAQLGQRFSDARADGETWGRLVETVVGAHLCNRAEPGAEISYWRERNREVDFVIRHGDRVLAIEVKSGRNKGTLEGLAEFRRAFGGTAGTLVVGTGGIPLDVFLATQPKAWLEQ
jgi:uncharacterized protein